MRGVIKGLLAEDIKKKRAQYRRLLSQVKKQIKFLRGALRGKEPV